MMTRLSPSELRLRLHACAWAIAFLTLGALAPSLQAQGRAECSVIRSQILSRAMPYCAFLPASFDQDKKRRYPVLYYFHGLGDDEQSLLSGGWDIISELRSKGKIGDFIVLAPRAGHTFYINSEDGKIRYEDFLMKEFMPQMESKYRAEGTRATRGIAGISMGGYGALRLAFKYPDEFAAVSAEMPALITNLPGDVASSAPGSPGALMGDVFGNPFNRSYFDRNNVFYFARSAKQASLKRLKIYFDVGNNDDYGFEQGAQELDKLLTSRGIAHEFHIYPGRHDSEFVIRHFADMIQFQWEAIGGGK